MKSPWSFPTSPRSPYKVIERLRLIKHLDGKVYNKNLQEVVGKLITNEDLTHKPGLNSRSSTLDLSGRDFLTRAPQKLGLVYTPSVREEKRFLFTEQGNRLLKSEDMQYILQRQIAKIQYPSPMKVRGTEHLKIIPLTTVISILKETKDLSRTELSIFVITIEKYTDIDKAIREILDFRKNIKLIKGNIPRRDFRKKTVYKKINDYYKDEEKNLRERAGKKTTTKDFINAKSRNHKDYSDATFRYLIMTGLFKINKKSRLELSKINNKDADFLLQTIGLKPQTFTSNKEKYVKNFLGLEKSVTLFTDDIKNITDKFNHLKNLCIKTGVNINLDGVENEFNNETSLDAKKNMTSILLKKLIKARMDRLITQLGKRDESDFDEILHHFEDINNRESEILDKPLQYEYNFFRAFAFIGDAKKIKPSLGFDEDVNPLHTTSNAPDLIIEYKDFVLVVEVTLSTGQRQYESEGAPVFRHVGKCQKEYDKPVFGLFIADKLDLNMPVEFLSRAMVRTKIYDGRVKIIPIDRKIFESFFTKIYKNKFKSSKIHDIFDRLLSDDRLKKYQELGEEQWSKDIEKTLS